MSAPDALQLLIELLQLPKYFGCVRPLNSATVYAQALAGIDGVKRQKWPMNVSFSDTMSCCTNAIQNRALQPSWVPTRRG